MLALITQALSFLGNLFGFGSKVADAQVKNAANAAGVTAQVAADERKTTDVQQAELGVANSARDTSSRLRSGSF